MVTNYPMASHGAARTDTNETHTEAPGVLDRVRQVFCGLHGHDTLLQFEQDRMFLRCVSCGHETPGWELNETRPTVTLRGDASRQIVRPQLVSARRVA